jgi:hypothetical protein
MTTSRLHTAPLAVATNGTLLVNGRTFTTSEKIEAALEAAKEFGTDIFIGVALRESEARRLLLRMEDSFAEVASTVRSSRKARKSL